MLHTTIEWTDATFNPWIGCVNVSPACDHCYAETMANRKMWTADELWGKDTTRRISSDAYWNAPHAWNRTAGKKGISLRVFCGSMCDVMERRADLNGPRKRLFKLIDQTPNLTWMLLTKRPLEYIRFLPKRWLKDPRPNVWLMITMERDDYLWRIHELLKAPAVVHGLSVEPMLGPITLPPTFRALGNRAWVMTGGETGPGARPSQAEWFRNLRDQCVSAGVPFFFKQWGERGSDLVKIGKKEAGRVLDGREWNEYPLGG
jgi:protein gp37